MNEGATELVVRKTRLTLIVRALIAFSVAMITTFGALAIYSLSSDNRGLRLDKSQLLDQIQAQSEELACRSAAATAQSSALADLSIATSQAAEFALHGGRQGDPVKIADDLAAARVLVRKTTDVRNKSIESCDVGDLVGVWPPLPAFVDDPLPTCLGSAVLRCDPKNG